MEQAEEVPIENGGLLAQDDEAKYTPDIAIREAQLLVRIEEAAENGGVLSPGVSSAYRPEELDREKWNTLRQYAHQDHLVKAVTGFRALMLDEHNKHRSDQSCGRTVQIVDEKLTGNMG
jgi:helicase SWR1